MPKKQLTKIQQAILDCLKEEILKNGYPPTVREICNITHLSSTSSVHAHLITLEKNGYIKRNASKPRAIEILDNDFITKKNQSINVPIHDTDSSSKAVLKEKHITNYFPIPAQTFSSNSKNESFMIVVRGESMINAGIKDQDFVIVEATSTAKNGDIIVAMINGEETVKTYYKENGKIRLQPENDFMKPIIVDDCKIIGKVKGVLRLFN